MKAIGLGVLDSRSLNLLQTVSERRLDFSRERVDLGQGFKKGLADFARNYLRQLSSPGSKDLLKSFENGGPLPGFSKGPGPEGHPRGLHRLLHIFFGTSPAADEAVGISRILLGESQAFRREGPKSSTDI